MDYQVVNILVLGIIYLALFGGAEFLFHNRNWNVEKTRKLVHVGSGVVAMLFPVIFESLWAVVFLSVSFLGLLAISKRYGFLPSINAVDRKTSGSYWFPLAVISCFAAQIYFENIAFYYLPLLTLSFADPMACFVGKRMPLFTFQFKEGQKSLGGSLAFFVVALLLSSFYQACGFAAGIVMPLVIAGVCTFAEFFGSKGVDNISIPLACITTMYFFETTNMIYV